MYAAFKCELRQDIRLTYFDLCAVCVLFTKLMKSGSLVECRSGRSSFRVNAKCESVVFKDETLPCRYVLSGSIQ
jgi:hypothetical protein